MAVIVGTVATLTVPAATVTLDREILRLFPRETQGVAFVDVAGLRNTPLVQEFLNSRKPSFEGQVNDFLQATGFVPERDLDRVTAGKMAGEEMLVVVEARYDRLKFEQFMRDKNVPSETYQGWVTYGNSRNAVALVDNLVIAGHRAAVYGAIERKAAPAQSVLDNTEVLDAINTIEAGNQVWAAGRFTLDELPLPRRRPAQFDVLLKSLQGGTYQMLINQDVHMKAAGDFATPENARAVVDTLSGFMSVLQFQAANKPELISLIEGISLNATGQSVTLDVVATGDLLKKLHQPKSMGQ
jgi:hypothetical protein